MTGHSNERSARACARPTFKLIAALCAAALIALMAGSAVAQFNVAHQTKRPK